MLVSIVIPVFRSEESICQVYQDIISEISSLELDYQLIFVEDCGGDNSWQLIEEMAEQDANILAIQLNRNYGQHNALACGLSHAVGDVIITMDDDGQHPASEIAHLIEHLNEGFDVVYGAPKSKAHSLYRTIASRTLKLVLSKGMGAEVAEKVSAFRALRSNVIGVFKEYQGNNINIDVMLTWATKSFSSVEVTHKFRQHGESGYSFRTLFEQAMNLITGFSTLPLQAASYMGFLFSGFGFLSLVYISIVYAIYGSVVPGFAFLGAIISIFSGVQLLTMGIIGEYIARIYSNSNAKPPYLIRKKVSTTEDHK